MSRGGRRALLLLGLAAALLVGGRALAGFLANRWWFESAAPEAFPFYSRRALLRGLLDLGATALAVVWFAGHALALLRAARGPGGGSGGNPLVRRALHHRDARLWSLALAVALGSLSGLGASSWADPLLLAWEGVRFGASDPSIGLDIGILVGHLPAWLRVHAFLTTLVVSTVGIALAGHFLAGTVRIGRGRVTVTDPARRHLGLLLAVLAAVIAVYQILTPYSLAAGIPQPVEPGIVLLHRSVAFVLVGVSLAVIALSLLWAVRPIHSLAAGAWLALSLALITTYFFLPTGKPWPSTPEERAASARLETLAYALEPREDSSRGSRPEPTLWDPEIIARLVARDSIRSAPTARLAPSALGPSHPAWLGLRTEPTGEIVVVAIVDDTVGAGGRPLFLDGSEVASEPRPLFTLPPLSARPAASGVQMGVGEAGVATGGWVRRLLLAWALQSTGPLQDDRRVGWLLDPVDRLRHAAPFATWSRPALVRLADRWAWMCHGFVQSEAFPGTRREDWQGRRVGYVRAGLVGTVDARSGRVAVFLGLEPDSLSAAWARASGTLVHPTNRLPSEVREALDYPRELLQLHTLLWKRAEAERLGRPPTELVDGEPMPTRTGWMISVTDQRPGRLHAVLEGRMQGEQGDLVVHRADTVGLEAPDVLERRWGRFPSLQVLRDSVSQSTGARFELGRVRYVPTAEGLLAYQPSWGVGPSGAAALAVVAVAQRNRLAIGRTFEEAWTRLRGEGGAPVSTGEGESAILFEARRWLREADSALRRGDLTAFARAFAALRVLLEGPP